MKFLKKLITQKVDHPVKIGLLGVGYISQIHHQAFDNHPQAEVVAICDTNQKLLKQRQTEFGSSVTVFSEPAQLISNDQVDVVDILLPHYLHTDFIIQSLKAGKNVICEKPPAINHKDLSRLNKLSRSQQNKVHLKYYFQFAELHQKLKGMIQQRVIGDIYFVDCTYTTNALESFTDKSWKNTIIQGGGGILMDVGIHMIDLLQTILDKPKAVTANTHKHSSAKKNKGETLATITLEYPQNILVKVTCIANDPSRTFHWEKRFYGNHGMIEVIDFGHDLMELRLYQDNEQKTLFRQQNWWADANQSSLANIVSNIYHQLPPVKSLKDATYGVKTILSAYQSSQKKKRVIIK